MQQQSVKSLLCLFLLLSVVAGCSGQDATPTPIVIVVTPGPTQAGVITVVVTPPPPQSEPTTEEVTPPPVEPKPTTQVEPSPPPTSSIELRDATFARGLSEEMQPVDPTTDFAPDETIHLSLRISGRPEEGVVTARFYWRDSFIAEAGVDLADVNSELIFSIGEDTYAGYILTHEDPFPVSDRYRAEVFYGDQPLGEYAFRVVPPEGAIPSQVSEVTLALGADENYVPIEPTGTFAFDQTVYLVGGGDLGLATWLQADWYISGELDEAGTRSLSLEENAPDVGFAFSYLPDGGWPPGEHFVVLTMNDQEVGRYSFTVISSGGAAPLDEAAFWNAFPAPEDAEVVEVAEDFDVGFATAMTEPEIFDAYAAWLQEQGWQQQPPTEARAALPHQVWQKDGAELLIEIQGLDEEGRTIVWVQLTATHE